VLAVVLAASVVRDHGAPRGAAPADLDAYNAYLAGLGQP
jgi:hypothetical protein